MARHKPDHEAHLIQRRTPRACSACRPQDATASSPVSPPASTSMPEHIPEPAGPQQLDLEEAVHRSPQLVA